MRYFNFILLIFLSFQLEGQTLDSLIALDDIVILDTIDGRKDNFIGDPSMSSLIAEETSLFVKNYGPSSIATISLRGSNASQVGVEWNGISIANPMLGLTDLGIMHSFMIDRVTINTNDINPTSLAGTVELQSQLNRSGNIEVYNAFGSYGLKEHGLKGKYTYKSLSGEIRLLRTGARNDFNYSLVNGERFKTSNAALASNSMQILLDYNLDEKSILRLSIWGNEYRREIPKLTTQNESLAFQSDDNWRAALAYKRVGKLVDLDLNIGVSDGAIDYRDPKIALIAKTDFTTTSLSTQLRRSYKIGESQLRFRNENTVSFAEAYGGKKNRNVASVSVNQIVLLPIFRVDASVGFKNVDLKSFYPNFRVGVLKELHSNILVKGLYKRSVRVPTTNDLFWSNGGNPDLKPEVADEFSISGQYFSRHWNVNVTGYHRTTRDWILWARPAGFQSFAAFNIAEASSYGVEAKVQYKVVLAGNQKLIFVTIPSIGKSVNQRQISLPRINKGDQLLYTPTYTFKNNIGYTMDQFRLDIRHQVYSEMQGINDGIDPYQIANVETSYQFDWNKLTLSTVIGVYNIFNENYRIIEFRPMPGRNYKFTLNLKF